MDIDLIWVILAHLAAAKFCLDSLEYLNYFALGLAAASEEGVNVVGDEG